ncbi:MAG: hypothetical protein JO202_07295 [Ktedonobacteraceae bacterium]|nr:hypothetical protein [Ktedonobacteraceae bacterium]
MKCHCQGQQDYAIIRAASNDASSVVGSITMVTSYREQQEAAEHGLPSFWQRLFSRELCLQRDEQPIGFIAIEAERMLRKAGSVFTIGEQTNAAIAHDDKRMLP